MNTEKVTCEDGRYWFYDSIGMRVGPFSNEQAAFECLADHIEFQEVDPDPQDKYGEY